jgi:hypothetical protein
MEDWNIGKMKEWKKGRNGEWEKWRIEEILLILKSCKNVECRMKSWELSGLSG